jgi:tetratricopeptide (TPR) repeat protein/DNA-binding CsgD family transcriptional regulator
MAEISLKTKIKRLEQQNAKAKTAFTKVDSLLELSKLLTRADTSRAIRLADEALELSRSVTYEMGTAKALYYLAGYYSSIFGDNTKALEYATLALKIYTKAENTLWLSHTLGTLSTIYTNLGDYKQANEYGQLSKADASRSGDAKAMITAMNRLGTLSYHQGNYAEAIDYHHEALQMSREHNDTEMEAILLNNLAHSYNITGNLNEALRANTQSLYLKIQRKDVAGIIISHMNIAAIHSDFKDYVKALEHLQQALELANQTNNLLRKTTVLMHIGTLRYESGQFHEALEDFKNAQAIIAEINQPLLEYELQLDRGACEMAIGMHEQGIENLLKAYHNFEKVNSLEKKGQTCKQLAQGYRLLKKYPESLRFADEGIEISKRIESNVQVAENLLEHAQTLYEEGKFGPALESALNALTIGQQYDDTHSTIESFKIIAAIYEASGDFKNSVEYFHKYLKARGNELNAQVNHKVRTLQMEFDVERIRHEAELNKLKSEQFEREVTMKNKELTSLALHLVNKNEFLKTLGEQINEDVSNTSHVIKNLSKLVADSTNSENEWKLFEKQFLQVNPDFTARLEEISGSSLSATELKICSLLRTGLNSQEVANVLFLSKRTVENHRYNIHKKLNLGSRKLIPYLMQV